MPDDKSQRWHVGKSYAIFVCNGFDEFDSVREGRKPFTEIVAQNYRIIRTQTPSLLCTCKIVDGESLQFTYELVDGTGAIKRWHNPGCGGEVSWCSPITLAKTDEAFGGVNGQVPAGAREEGLELPIRGPPPTVATASSAVHFLSLPVRSH